MTKIDHTDKNIINRIQTFFPIDPHPYRIIAKELGISEDELISRVKRLKDNGVIRRIGGNFGPYKLGFFSTLCAASVPDKNVDIFTKVVNSYSGVTHNYMRSHRYNIWFTFIAESMEIIENSLKEISEQTGVDDILNLPATDVFKISANFKVT
ncbi:MAG: Lrp/AsnC family transcriptional regulator [Desulfamplus sp.]|nr:Lrp/AsnC family transcriptional regulator [Desulfamplus sp.]MBF0411120.1 Lrp/AsnC family transcriptional regulator [Desulfamplus sp.]